MVPRVISMIDMEKRLRKLEARIDNLEQTLVTFKDVISNLHEENEDLKKGKTMLLESQKKLVEKIPVDSGKLAREVRLISLKKQHETQLSRLYKLVQEKKSISMAEAGRKLGVPEPVIEEWSEKLKEHGLVEIEGKEMRLVG